MRKISKSRKAAERAVRKVNARAFTFRPDVLLTVGVDVANGRVLISEIKKNKNPYKIHFDTLHKQITLAARMYCVKERTRLGIYKKDCSHPWSRKRTKKGVTTCTKCGEVLS